MTGSVIGSASESHVAYASFTVRARALVTDALIQSSAIVALVFTAAGLESPGAARVAVAGLWAVALLYEPLQVALRGATFGHRRANIRVVRDGTGGRPSFGLAFVRFLLKAILGLPSFAAMLFTERHQALHDLLTHTTVQVIDVDEARDFDMVEERPAEPAMVMPPVGLRIIVSGAYMFLLWNVVIIAMSNSVSLECLTGNQCTVGEDLVQNALSFGLIAAMIAIPILGWFGRLPGARRRPAKGLPVPMQSHP